MKGNAGEHIRWCLERDQIKLTEPQEGIANSYLKKSREALEAASLLEENGFYDWTVTAAYFARYFALTSLLRSCGVVCDNHSCAISILKKAFVESGELDKGLMGSIRKAKNNRIEKQYDIVDTEQSFASEEREEAIEFVTDLSSYIETLSQETIDSVRGLIEERS